MKKILEVCPLCDSKYFLYLGQVRVELTQGGNGEPFDFTQGFMCANETCSYMVYFSGVKLVIPELALN